MGYAAYFLIVRDLVNFAKRSGILTTVRGSAAGSLVLYALNGPAVDPIAYRLPFERFLNPQRVTMPDIDVDFMDSRRDEVIRYVMDRYGADHVAQIIPFGTMGARPAVRAAPPPPHPSPPAAGIIIPRDPLIEHVPLQRATKSESTAGARPAEGEAAVMPVEQYELTAVGEN